MNTVASAPSVSEQLVRLLARPVTNDDRERAALHLIDWMGCALAGQETVTGRLLCGEAFGPLARTDVPNDHGRAGLAFDLGGLGSILEMDDVDRQGLLHPGPVVMAAAFAIADNASGHAMLDAIVRGYEAMIRLGRAVGGGHYALFHNTSTTGGLGAALAASVLLGLDDHATVWALGNATSVTGGFWQCRHEQVMTKPFHCAEAARRGVMAALLAARGVTGPRFILEGPQGMFAAICPGADPRALLAAPEAGWLIHEVSFKPWPACRHAHAVIDAALALRQRIDRTDIAAIDIDTYADAVTFCDQAMPRTETEAKFSLQHAAAVALIDGPPSIQAFKLDALGRPRIAALRGKMNVSQSATYTAAYPHHFGAAVTVTMRDGRRVAHGVDDAWGDSENPMARDAILAKFQALALYAGLDAAKTDMLAVAATALTRDAPVAPLRAAFAQALSRK